MADFGGALDLGLLYFVVGAGALVLDRFGVALFFEPIVVRLTVVHFYYAGFALPVVAGLTGRLAPQGRFQKLFPATSGVIALGPALIAVGITFAGLGTTVGRLVEVIAVGVFTTAVALFSLSVVVGVLPRLSGRVQQVFVGVASLTVTATMVVALVFDVARFTGGRYFGIDAAVFGRTVRWHGQYNAYGFGLLALLGWRFEAPEARARPPGITFSKLTSGWRVGPEFLEQTGHTGSDDRTGMVDSLGDYLDDPAAVHPDVRWLYERSAETVLEGEPDWAPLPGLLAPIYRKLVGPLGQLSLPTQRLFTIYSG